jgi:DHA2 family multidrug resistance protein
VLLLARVVQGAGGGGMQPMAQAIMADSFEEKKRGQAFALYGLVAVLAPSIGPTLGGWITDNYSWRWIFYLNIPVGILAVFLVSRFVDDPPWIKADPSNLKRLDYMGLGFLTIAMGGMQIMLDKGEEDAWFASRFIQVFGTLFVVGMIGFIWREWDGKSPIMNLKLLRHKNFAVCALLMIMVGGLINATTVLQPQFSQALLRYTATLAGEALTGGGLALLVVMPLAGFAAGRFPARNIAALGFALFVGAFYYTSTHLTLNMSFGNATWLRVLQVAPIPLCFIAITNAAYIGLPKEASNQVSGIINFVRNIGGSIFIAGTGAIVTNRTLFHEARLADYMQPSNPIYANHLSTLTQAYGAVTSGPGAAALARGSIYRELSRQASGQGYQDIYRLLAWLALGMFFFALLLNRNKPGQEAPAGEAG